MAAFWRQRLTALPIRAALSAAFGKVSKSTVFPFKKSGSGACVLGQAALATQTTARDKGLWRGLTPAAAHQSLLKGKRIKDAFVLLGAIMRLTQGMINGTSNEMILGNNVW